MDPSLKKLFSDQVGRLVPQGELRLGRRGKKNPKKWVCSTGTPETRSRKAGVYLKRFNYQEAMRHDYPEFEFTLAKVVCNLRKFYCQSREETIRLILDLYNPKADLKWSAEGIGLTWDLVEPYSPTMGLRTLTARRKHTADDLYDAVVDLVLLMEPGGRVPTADFYQLFLSLNPDMNPVPTDVAVGIAVGDVTGKTSTPSKNKRYYSGFRIPSELRMPVAA